MTRCLRSGVLLAALCQPSAGNNGADGVSFGTPLLGPGSLLASAFSSSSQRAQVSETPDGMVTTVTAWPGMTPGSEFAGSGFSLHKSKEELAAEREAEEAAADEEARAVKHGTQIFVGMVDSFLHRKNATKKELECLVQNLEGVAYQGYTKSAKVSHLMEGMEGKSVAGMGMQLPQLAFCLHGLLALPRGAIERCTTPQAIQALNLAAFHLSNLTYVAGHMTANGADILDEIADAVASLRDGSYTGFGRHLGKAGRKVLLSNSSSDSSLPEGPPTEDQIINVSAGIIQGFFGEGFVLDITAEHKVSTLPLNEMMRYFHKKRHDSTALPPLADSLGGEMNIHIDLHSCVHKNLDFFQSALFGAWFVFAGAAVNVMEVTQAPIFLSSVMHALPGALKRCGVTREKIGMLEDSVLALQHVHVDLQTPDTHSSYNKTIRELHTAAKHWEQMEWFTFGEDLGNLLMELVLGGFPELYSVGPSGRLLKLPSPGDARQAAVGTAARVMIVGLVALLSVLLALRWRISGPPQRTSGAAGAELALERAEDGAE